MNLFSSRQDAKTQCIFLFSFSHAETQRRGEHWVSQKYKNQP